MKKSIISGIIIITTIFSLVSCLNLAAGGDNSKKIYLFQPEKESYNINLSLSYIMWGTGDCGPESNAIPVHNGDLLNIYLKDAGSNAMLFRYDKKDGIQGQIDHKKRDENTYLFTLNNSVIQLNLSNEPDVWEWLEKAGENDLKSIRSLCFTGDVDASSYQLLRKVAKVNKSPDICFENYNQLLNVLPMFQPECMILGKWNPPDNGGSSIDNAYDILKKQKNCNKIFIPSSVENPDIVLGLLAALPALKSIMISPSLFNQIAATALPENLKNLEELIIAGDGDKDIADFTFVKELAKMNTVRFIRTHLSGNINDLYSLPRLTTISFSGTEVTDFPDIQNIRGLKWFSFPANTVQAYFKAFLEINPQLEYIEIINCQNISDLSPLMYLKNPKGIIIIDTEIDDYTPLSGIKGLEFLILPKNSFNKETGLDREALEKQLPQTTIICGEPFCLGSGWILLFPASVIISLLFIFCRRKILIYIKRKS